MIDDDEKEKDDATSDSQDSTSDADDSSTDSSADDVDSDDDASSDSDSDDDDDDDDDDGDDAGDALADGDDDDDDDDDDSETGITQAGSELIIHHPFKHDKYSGDDDDDDDDDSSEDGDAKSDFELDLDILVIQTLTVKESLDDFFTMEAHVISEIPDLDFRDIIGREVAFTLVQLEEVDDDDTIVAGDDDDDDDDDDSEADASGDSETEESNEDTGTADSSDDSDDSTSTDRGDDDDDDGDENPYVGNRYFHGIVTNFSQYATPDPNGDQITRYKIILRPKMFLLTLAKNCRVFQDQTPFDMIQTILNEHGVVFEIRGAASEGDDDDDDSSASSSLRGGDEPRDYCVQYNETDYDFVCRLMQEEGICFFFKHGLASDGDDDDDASDSDDASADSDDGSDAVDPTKTKIEDLQHMLVLADAPEHFEFSNGSQYLEYSTEDPKMQLRSAISVFQCQEQVASSSFALDDYNITNASTPPYAMVSGEMLAATSGDDDDDDDDDDDTSNEAFLGALYEYQEHLDFEGKPTQERLEAIAEIRLQEAQARRKTVALASKTPYLNAGAKFEFSEYPREDANRGYVVYGITHEMTTLPPVPGDDSAENSDSGEDASSSDSASESGDFPLLYQNTIDAFPDDLPYRPRRTLTRPVITNVQSAIVMGPDGEELYVDEYGRIQIQFMWDGHPNPPAVSGAGDDDDDDDDDDDAGDDDDDDDDAADDPKKAPTKKLTSCWVRVQQGLAGNNWGMMFTPRVGMEVLVSFINGNPSRPVVTGCLYNSDHMPPYMAERVTGEMSPTKSGIKTRSSKLGADDEDAYNELRFEDKVGEEQVFFRAQKDWDAYIIQTKTEFIETGSSWLTLGQGDRVVTLSGGGAAVAKESPEGQEYPAGLGDDILTLKTGSRYTSFMSENGAVRDLTYVAEGLTEYQNDKGSVSCILKEGNYKTTLVKGDRDVVLKEGNDFHKVVTGDRQSVIETGNRTHEIITGDDKTYIHTGNDLTYIETGDQQVRIDAGNMAHKLDAGNMTSKLTKGDYVLDLEAGDQKITIQAGDTVLTLKKGDIKEDVTGNYDGKYSEKFTLTVTGPIAIVSEDKISITATGDLELTSQADVKIEAGGDFKVTATGDVSLTATGDVKTTSTGGTTFTSTGDATFTSTAGLDLKSGTPMSIDAGASLALKSAAAFTLDSGASIKITDAAGLTAMSGGSAMIKASSCALKSSAASLAV